MIENEIIKKLILFLMMTREPKASLKYNSLSHYENRHRKIDQNILKNTTKTQCNNTTENAYLTLYLART